MSKVGFAAIISQSPGSQSQTRLVTASQPHAGPCGRTVCPTHTTPPGLSHRNLSLVQLMSGHENKLWNVKSWIKAVYWKCGNTGFNDPLFLPHGLQQIIAQFNRWELICSPKPQGHVTPPPLTLGETESYAFISKHKPLRYCQGQYIASTTNWLKRLQWGENIRR